MPHRIATRPRRAPKAPEGAVFPSLKLAFRIQCDLCGRTAHAEPCASEEQASAAFRGRGFALRRSRSALLVVCRQCARHLGAHWVDPDAAAAPAASAAAAGE